LLKVHYILFSACTAVANR